MNLLGSQIRSLHSSLSSTESDKLVIPSLLMSSLVASLSFHWLLERTRKRKKQTWSTIPVLDLVISDQRVFSLPWRHLRRQLWNGREMFVEWTLDFFPGNLLLDVFENLLFQTQSGQTNSYLTPFSRTPAQKTISPSIISFVVEESKPKETTSSWSNQSKIKELWGNLVLLNIGQLLLRTSHQHS